MTSITKPSQLNAASDRNKAWVIAAIKKLKTGRSGSRDDTVHVHDLSLGNGDSELQKLMLDMVGDSDDDLFDPKRLYLHWSPECGCHDDNDSPYATFSKVSDLPHGPYECEVCEEVETATTDNVWVEFHLRTDAPIYEVAPERYHAEGYTARTLNDCPYIRESRPALQWCEGWDAQRRKHWAAKQELMARSHHTTTGMLEHIEALLTAPLDPSQRIMNALGLVRRRLAGARAIAEARMNTEVALEDQDTGTEGEE